MPEPIESWWERRRFSRGVDLPYPPGRYSDAWASFPVLALQYHPEFNRGILLSQIPPAADVFLTWQCDSGHLFVATPEEQRQRPGRVRRRSSWCPECLELARPRPAPLLFPDEAPAKSLASSSKKPAARKEPTLCRRTPSIAPGEPFVSECAPKPASAVEGELRAGLVERLLFTHGLNAIRLSRPFFDHLEAWPDIVLPELRIVVEYDSTGRHGLEHVGKKEAADRRKDRALRSVGWEVVRLRDGHLEQLGPYDIQVRGMSKKVFPRLFDAFRDVRGSFLVDAYLLE
jgi:hypothetical protein